MLMQSRSKSCLVLRNAATTNKKRCHNLIVNILNVRRARHFAGLFLESEVAHMMPADLHRML